MNEKTEETKQETRVERKDRINVSNKFISWKEMDVK